MSNLLKSLDKINMVWRKHALQRMLERSITRDRVKLAITKGRIIEEYPDDTPFSSLLVAYVVCEKPLHVVVSYDKKEHTLYIIIAYEPSTKYFNEDLLTRRNNA